ncbi:MAG: hypothetical protein ACD_28C00013G0001 [uncultured bacterium]|nr:MAG: hypothetical protein ACD_28C00013G0001 [uncultured bacterium]
MKFFNRSIQPQIEAKLFKGKAIIIYGPRQVGKTVLCKTLLKQQENSIYLNCDEPDIEKALTEKTSTALKQYIGKKNFVIIDEAQRVKNIGITLKLLIDNYPEMQVIATGSSSFELANEISEPLTGRAFEFQLFPLSLEEMSQEMSRIEIHRNLNNFLRFGSYPEMVANDFENAKESSTLLAQNYLYKDILKFENLKSPELLEKILQALALQIGNEVSYTELASLLSVNKITIEKYIDLLEKSFVIFRLNPFSRNLRKELGKMKKIYFYDLGIRNSLIQNFNTMELRNDTGNLFENFCISERIKYNVYNGESPNIYFWRTYDKKEIDFIEEQGGKLAGFKFKWKKDRFKKPDEFLKTYANSSIELINQENYLDWLVGK